MIRPVQGVSALFNEGKRLTTRNQAEDVTMYGDTDVLRRRADQLREQGVDVRMLAEQLMAQTEGLGWTGRAAESMRLRVQERATHLRAVAAEHDTAADSLDRHTQEVTTLQDAIAERERTVASLVTDARTRVARVEAANDADAAVRRLPDADDTALAAFTPPPPGHLDWLTVELPGLRDDSRTS
jgi:uncharacterized protein (DUF3084 family)